MTKLEKKEGIKMIKEQMKIEKDKRLNNIVQEIKVISIGREKQNCSNSLSTLNKNIYK